MNSLKELAAALLVAPPSLIEVQKKAGNRTLREILNGVNTVTFLQFDVDEIVFPTGTAVGGEAHVNVSNDGTVQFSGRLHDSGLTKTNYSVAFVIRDAANRAYTVGRTGSLGGSASSGSRDDFWDGSGQNRLLARNWPALAVGSHAVFRGSVSQDLESLITDTVALVGMVVAVIQVVISK